MKQYYLISVVIAFFSVNASGQEGWTLQTSPSSTVLSGVYAIDSLNVWAVGQKGLIIHTTDGGVSWDSVPNGTESNLLTVEFINADTGFVGGSEDASSPPFTDNLIQRTTDGGLTWEFQDLPSGDQMTIADIDFIIGPPGEPMRGYSTGGLSHAWRTDNLGDPWEHVRGGCGEGNFNSCYFVDSVTGWFVGTPANVNPYTIMHTADGGKSFEEQTSPVDIKLNGVCFGTDLKGVAVGNAGTIIYTSDGGKNWEQSTDDDIKFTTWFSVFLTESGKAWAVGNKGMIAYSMDWGHTWELLESGVSQPLWEVHFINENVGWIVGGLTSSIILHTKNGGMTTTGISDFSDEITKSYSLEQNYPNPFSSSTQIVYNLTRSSNITLTIYDLSGRKIQTLVDEFKTAGEHTIDWDASHLCNGLYFCKFEVDNEPGELKKMVLAR
jgi:photosystem II stability/assembly factor-like uncharacterized protein